jgi:hypothetical protein
MLDLTAFVQEVPGALEALGVELRHALERPCQVVDPPAEPAKCEAE